MQIEAVYNNGKLEFLEPVQFKQDRVRVVVTVPDEEIVSAAVRYNLPQEAVEMAEKMRRRLDGSRRNAGVGGRRASGMTRSCPGLPGFKRR